MTTVADRELPVIDLTSPEYEANPYGTFRAAREQSWLARVGAGYAVLGNADARAIMRHPDFRVSFAYVDPDISAYLYERSKSGLMAASADRHRRLRGVAVRALRPRVMDSMRPPMQAIIGGLIDAVIDRGECDIVRDLTDPFPARVMMPVLGVPVESHALKGMDSLLSIVQMPAGIPVGTLAIGRAGAVNAALLAAAILATHDTTLAGRLDALRAAQTAVVADAPESGPPQQVPADPS